MLAIATAMAALPTTLDGEDSTGTMRSELHEKLDESIGADGIFLSDREESNSSEPRMITLISSLRKNQMTIATNWLFLLWIRVISQVIPRQKKML